MKTQLQITCDPNDWDASMITACGLTHNGRTLLPQSRVASALPEPWLSAWRGLVEMMRGLAPGEWAARLIIAERTERCEEVAADDAAPVYTPMVRMTIYRRWDDGTTAEPLTVDLVQSEALGLYDYLVNTDNNENGND